MNAVCTGILTLFLWLAVKGVEQRRSRCLGSNAKSQGIISHILADGIIEGTGLLSVEIKPDIICRAISDLEDHYG